jgi:carboxymethylenebutenolidase
MGSEYVTLNVDGADMKTWVAIPEGNGPFPGVVVAQHAGGMDTFIRSVCDRLAEAGFAAAAPDMYHRQDGMTFEELDAMAQDDPERWPSMMAKARQMTDDQIASDANAAYGLLRTLAQVGPSPIGVMGFCGGGRVAYMMAARNQDFAASAVFHAGSITEARADRPASLDLTSKINCPVAGFFGLDDQNPSPEHVAQISAELDKHGKAHQFHSYENTGHSFLDHTNPKAYREAAATQAWPALIDFFTENLKA